MKDREKFKVLFVCLGNICRSPLAEGIFRDLVDKKNLANFFEIDSCGTGSWHIGEPPHPETRKNAKKNGLSIEDLRARQVADEDLYKFDLIVAMDTSNRLDLQSLPGAREARIEMLRDYDPDKDFIDVPDPYFGGRDGFQTVYDIVHRSCSNLLSALEKELF